ncbi:unnamed protein product [Trichobilharzia szidati]|nr:unnamed protein product [Trichobilharzia szidati]CAH8850487.1 unnamed protein product [Trichobilharzia szidati]
MSGDTINMLQSERLVPYTEVLMEIFLFLCKLTWCCICELIKRISQIISPVYKDLSSDVVLITGADSGIGRLMCSEFAKYCSTIIAVGLNESSLKETSDIVDQETGIHIKTYVCDFRHKKQIDALTENVLKEFGKVTILVNNAGVVNGNTVVESTPDAIEDCFKVNVLSHFYLIKAFLPTMLNKCHVTNSTGGHSDLPVNKYRHPRGHIVCISSIAGYIPLAGGADYCASKAASNLLSESVELELANLGIVDEICITRILPFLINTNMFKGVTPKHPWLFPTVDASHCARRIVESVRLNERVVYITARYRVLPVLKLLLPTKVIHCLYEFSNTGEYINQLKAHRKKTDEPNSQ